MVTATIPVRIKRRASTGATGAPSALLSTEIAYNEADDTLYLGYGDDGSGNATSIKAIGGSGAFLGTGPTNLIGNDSTDNQAALSSADTAGPVILKKGTYRVATSLTISNIIFLMPGAVIKPASGATVTFDGGIFATPNQKIFDTSLGGSIALASHIKAWAGWWGAVPDTTTATNQTAFNAAIASGSLDISAAPGTYYITDKVDFGPLQDLVGWRVDFGACQFIAGAAMANAMIGLAPTDPTAHQLTLGRVIIGTVNGNKGSYTHTGAAAVYARVMTDVKVDIGNIVNHTTMGFACDQRTSVGAVFSGTFNNNITIGRIDGCAEGSHLWADSETSYNNGVEGNIFNFVHILASGSNGLTVGDNVNDRIINNTFNTGPIELNGGWGVYTHAGGNLFTINDENGNTSGGFGSISGITRKNNIRGTFETGIDTETAVNHEVQNTQATNGAYSSLWNANHLKLGGSHIWVDGSGNLRINGGAPSSDTSGIVVGTQS